MRHHVPGGKIFPGVLVNMHAFAAENIVEELYSPGVVQLVLSLQIRSTMLQAFLEAALADSQYGAEVARHMRQLLAEYPED